MALKFEISKADYDKLSDDIKAEYSLSGNKAKLDVEGLDTLDELKTARDHERDGRKRAEKKLKDVSDKLGELEEASSDLRNVEENWKTKLKTETEKRDTTIAKLQDGIRKEKVDGAAMALAGELSKAPVLLAPHIAARIVVEFEGDEPVTRYKGADGKVDPKLTVDDLKKDVVANKAFADILLASKASGGGAPRDPNTNGSGLPLANGGAGFPNNQQPVADLSKMSGKELVQHLAAKKAAEAAQP